MVDEIDFDDSIDLLDSLGNLGLYESLYAADGSTAIWYLYGEFILNHDIVRLVLGNEYHDSMLNDDNW